MPAPSSVQHALPWWKTKTVITRVDELAIEDSSRVYAAYPVSPLTYDQGYREFTYAELANIVNGIAWLLEREVGHGGPSETLAYIGPNDIRYTALILGAAKAGHKVVNCIYFFKETSVSLPNRPPISIWLSRHFRVGTTCVGMTKPQIMLSGRSRVLQIVCVQRAKVQRNSVAAQLNLFEATKCQTILSPSPRPPQITSILDVRSIRCIDIPTIDELLSQVHHVYEFTKTLDQIRNEPFFTVHTSGSTGMPKPLVWTYQTAATNTQHMQLDPPPGYESQDRMVQKNRVFITFPPFHSAFLGSHLFNAIPHGTVMIAPTSGAIASGQGLVDALKHTDIDVAFLVPSIALDLAQDPLLLNIVAERVKRIFYSGGDLPQNMGEIIAAKVPLYNQYGSSEMGITPQIWGNRTLADWKYIEPHPGVSAEMRHSTSDLYEYYIVRLPEDQEQPAAFTIFPELDAYPSRDLYVRHPTNPKLWRWKARVDDVIVFLNGEKTNPITMEQHIMTKNAEVARALVAGAQRFQASLIVEPVDNMRALSVAERAALIERIWPSVEEANQICPAHAKIAKSHILFTSPEKPMMTAGKGTVQRIGTLAMYEKELDKMYADADTAANGAGQDGLSILSNVSTIGAVASFVRDTVLYITKFKKLGPDDNFFTLGMDSLQALLTLRRLRYGLRLPSLALSTIYTNPSVSQLSIAVFDILQSTALNQTKLQAQSMEELQQVLTKYQSAIDAIPAPASNGVNVIEHVDKGIGVLLTGSTGALGCHLLDALLSNPAVTSIRCLNRASDGGKSLQSSRLSERGLSGALATDRRVSFYHADASKSDLGLSKSNYGDIKNTTTHIIHAAWPVDFNLPLSSFEPHVAGIVNLLSLAVASPSKVKFMFISSISSVMNLRDESAQNIPEVVVESLKAPAAMGYAQTKFIGERLLAHAAAKLSSDSVGLAFARVGQVAGAIEETSDPKDVVTWKPAEWFPSLVLSSAFIGALPSSLGTMSRIDWVPVDVLGRVLSELTLVPSSQSLSPSSKPSDTIVEVFHPHNPCPTDWEALQSAIIAEVQAITGKKLDIVSPEVWIAEVQKVMETSADLGQGKTSAVKDEDLTTLLKINPAVKLLDWYKESLTSKSRGSVLATDVATEKSKTLRGLAPIQADWMRKWTREWLSHAGYA